MIDALLADESTCAVARRIRGGQSEGLADVAQLQAGHGSFLMLP